MVREVKTKQAGSLTDVMTLHQQTFRLIDNIVVDVANGSATSCFVDNIAKITRRVSQFRGTPSDGRQALHQLPVLTKIGLKQIVKTLQQVNLSPVLFEQLALVDTVAVFQYQACFPENTFFFLLKMNRFILSPSHSPFLLTQYSFVIHFLK